MKNNKHTLLSATLLSACVLAGSAMQPCYAADTTSASPATATNGAQTRQEFVNTMTQSVLATLHDGKKPFIERQRMLQQTFTKVVDLDWIAKFVIGQSWNGASDDQKSRYVSLYRTYLTNTYVSNFDEDTEVKLKDIKVLAIKDADDHSFNVRTEMMMAESDPVKVDYRINDMGGQYKIIDISIEGISLLETHRSEFAQISSAGGINGVIEKLQQMVGNNASTVALSMK